jgi:hypothetical protein
MVFLLLWTLHLVPSRSLTTGFVSAPSSDGIRIMRAEPGDYLTCRRLSQLAVEAFYGEHSWTHGPAMYVQRGIIESDVLLDLAARLRYYEEARCRELTHVGAVYVAQVEATGALLGFADVGLSLYDRQKDSFSLPKRPAAQWHRAAAGGSMRSGGGELDAEQPRLEGAVQQRR